MDKKPISDIEWTRELLGDPQFLIAQTPIDCIETRRGGLSMRQIWLECEWLRKQYVETPVNRRFGLITPCYKKLATHTYNGEPYALRSLMVILMLFLLRLEYAHKDPLKNPHRRIMNDIIHLVAFELRKDILLKREITLLLQMIDKYGDELEAEGVEIPYVDILAVDDVSVADVRTHVFGCVDKLSEQHAIEQRKAQAVCAIWDELFERPWFLSLMQVPTLEAEFNLKLVFNIFGLLFPRFYTAKVRGANTLAQLIAPNEQARGKDKFFSKSYFSRSAIAKFKGVSALDNDAQLQEIDSIIHSIDLNTQIK